MSSRRRGSITALFLLLSLVFLAPTTAAARPGPRGERQRAAGEASFLARVGHLLANLFAPSGASLDPFGTPQGSAVAPTPPQTGAEPLGDSGPSLDPFGGH
jgi:hypothetical protein